MAGTKDSGVSDVSLILQLMNCSELGEGGFLSGAG